MKVKIDKSFEKDTAKLHDNKTLVKISETIEAVMKASSVSEIENLKKLTGFKNYFRIRIGDYRAGLTIKNGEVIFERFVHRKDIYKYYP